MNERINELAEQATTEEHDGFRYFDKAKFAELIVRECATIADTDFLPKGVGCGYVTYTKGERIKQHFGVEE